jgi:GntR family transcriptional regulator, transcriptional repressor for pyruvate dehydrogenase complex
VHDVSSQTSLQPTPRRKLTQAVAEQLLEHIRQQRLTPGTRMPSERELMSALNVGRSTVREALNGLALLGVIEVRHGQGAFVAALPQDSVSEELGSALAKGVTRDLLEARAVVEVEVARLAALRHTEADVRSMQASLEAQSTAMSDKHSPAPESATFHLEVAEAAHNEVLAGIVGSFMPLLEELGPALEELPGYKEWELEEHRQIVAAIASGDGDRAAKRMAEHLDSMVGHHERIGLRS